MTALVVPPKLAAAITSGAARAEYRCWRVDHRGPVVLVSASSAGPNARGTTACVVDLVDCRTSRDADVELVGRKPGDGCATWVYAEPRRVEPVTVPAEIGLYAIADELVVLARPVAELEAPVEQEEAVELAGGLF